MRISASDWRRAAAVVRERNVSGGREEEGGQEEAAPSEPESESWSGPVPGRSRGSAPGSGLTLLFWSRWAGRWGQRSPPGTEEAGAAASAWRRWRPISVLGARIGISGDLFALAPSCDHPVNMLTQQTRRLSQRWRPPAAVFLSFDFSEISPDFILGKPRCSPGTARE